MSCHRARHGKNCGQWLATTKWPPAIFPVSEAFNPFKKEQICVQDQTAPAANTLTK